MVIDIIIMILVHIGGIFAGLNIGYDMGKRKRTDAFVKY